VLVSRRARSRFVREGERLLVELATHAKSADLVTTLFYQGYAFTFDVPGRSARALARLERASRKLADGTALKERIRQLAEMREQWIAITTESLRNIDEESSRNFIAAYLGDARAAIKVCSRPPYNEDPQFREWLQEARRKRERERKRRGG